MIDDWYYVMTEFFIKIFFQRSKKYKLQFKIQNLPAVHISGYTVQWEYRKLPSILDWLEDLQTTVIYHFKKAEKMRHFLKKMRRSWKKKLVFLYLSHRSSCRVWCEKISLCHFLLLYFILSLSQSTTTQPIWQ